MNDGSHEDEISPGHASLMNIDVQDYTQAMRIGETDASENIDFGGRVDFASKPLSFDKRDASNDSFSDNTRFGPSTAKNLVSNHSGSGNCRLENMDISENAHSSEPRLLNRIQADSQSAINSADQNELIVSPEKQRSTLDIADFIDDFLGGEDLLSQLPDLAAGLTEVPGVSAINLLEEKPREQIAQNTSQIPPSTLIEDSRLRMSSSPQKCSTSLNSAEVPENPSRTTSAGPSTVRNADKKVEKRKPRTYSQAVPSQHCHICSRRPTEGSPHQVCGNLLKGRCRKTICTKCFHQFRWDLQAARRAPPGTWECPHCIGECPQRAQCVIYNRTSDRRRLKLINHRKRKGGRDYSSKSKRTTSSRRQDAREDSSPNSGHTSTPSLPILNGSSSIPSENVSSAPRVSVSNSRKTTTPKPRRTSREETVRRNATKNPPQSGHDFEKKLRTAASSENPTLTVPDLRSGTPLTSRYEPDQPFAVVSDPMETSTLSNPQFDTISDGSFPSGMPALSSFQLTNLMGNRIDHQQGVTVPAAHSPQYAQIAPDTALLHEDIRPSLFTPLARGRESEERLLLSDVDLTLENNNSHFSIGAPQQDSNPSRPEQFSNTASIGPESLDINEILIDPESTHIALDSSTERCPSDDVWLLNELDAEGRSNLLGNVSVREAHGNVFGMLDEGTPHLPDCREEGTGFLSGAGFAEILK